MDASAWPGWVETLLELPGVGEAWVWRLGSIPLVAAVVGWVTNWFAIRLTFQPLRFVGIPPWLGWQGIVPRKAEKMARVFVDSSMHRLGTLAELFREMQPEVIERHVDRVLAPRLVHYTDDVMAASVGGTWATLPPAGREPVYAAVADALPRLVHAVLAEITDEIEELVDFRHMVVTRLVQDPALLNRIFLESGAREFRFIVDSGFTFGFLFGLVQLATWLLAPAWWQLPLYGAAVGWATNWLALNLIFRPLRPRRIGPFVLQGLFLKRQREVADVWCRIVTREILTVRRLIGSMVTGPHRERARAVVIRHLRPLVDEALTAAGLFLRLALDQRARQAIERQLELKALAVADDPFVDERFNEGRARIVEELLRERMASLPPDEFQELLRPCFKEDEWILVALGGVFGLLAGLAQAALIF